MSKLTKEVGRQVYSLTYFQYYYRDDLWKNIIRKPNLYLFFPLKIMNFEKFQRLALIWISENFLMFP